MKILHVIARMNAGGTARYISILDAGLKREGFESNVATGHVQGAEIEDPSVDKIRIIRIPNLGRAISPIKDFRAIKELRKVIEIEVPDVIHSHTFKAGLIVRIQKAQLNKAANKEIKFVHTFHGHLFDDPEFSGFKAKLIVAIERFLARKTEKIITVGQRVADELLDKEIGTKSQFLNIPPGIKPLPEVDRSAARQNFNIGQEKFVIGWLARVTGVKNPQLVIEIAKALPQFEFMIGGTGDLFEELKIKSPINCKFLGWTNSSEFLAACDLIISTSHNEGIPVALIEAQMAGKPVIATNVGSVSEVIKDGMTGKLVEKSTEEFSSAIKNLVSDPQLLSDMAKKAQIRAKSLFLPEVMIEKHIDLYKVLA